MNKPILIVENPSDVDEVIRNYNLYSDLKVFSLNFLTHKILEKHKIVHKIGEDYLTDEDYKNIDINSIHLTTDWSNNDEISSSLIFHGIKLPNLIELELSHYFMHICRSVLNIMRIIEKENPDFVISFTLLNDFVERVCKQKNIPVKSIKVIEQPLLQSDKINIKFNISSIPISFTISRKKYLDIKRMFDKTINYIFKFTPNPNNMKNNSILLLDFNPTNYDVLIKELSLLNKNIILLNQRRPAIWNVQSLQVMKSSRCKIINLDGFEKKDKLKIETELEEFFNKITNMWKNDELFQKIFSLEHHTFWYSIRKSFIAICNARFKESVRRLMLLEKLFDKFNISVILEWAELGQEEKEVLSMSKKLGIKSVMLQHNMVAPKYWDRYARFVLSFSYPLISDVQAIWGQITQKHALSYGYFKDLRITGSPKHDGFFNIVKKHEKKGIILFATTQVSEMHAENSTTRAYLKFNEFVREVCRVAKLFPDKQIIVKPHPASDFMNDLPELIREIDPTIKINHTLNVKDLIARCDMLITFNNSTIALESLILDKPTMVLAIENWVLDSEIVKMGAVLAITDKNQIENGMRKILYDEKFRNEIEKNAKNFVNMELSNRGNASKSLANLLNSF